MIHFKCGQCGATVSAPDEAAGRNGRCPQCGCVCEVPDSGGENNTPQSEDNSLLDVGHSSGGGRGGMWICVAAAVVTAAVIAFACVKLMPRGGDDANRLPGPVVAAPSDQSSEPADQEPPQTPDTEPSQDDDQSAVTEPSDSEPDAGTDVSSSGQVGDEAESQPVGASSEDDEVDDQWEKPSEPVVREPTGKWNPQSKADVRAAVFGSANDEKADKVTDMAALADGSLVVCGVTQSPREWAVNVPIHCPAGSGDIDEDCPFVAKLSADLTELEWLSVLPCGSFEPIRLAIGPDDSVYLGGGKGENIASVAPDEDWSGRESVIARISADGSELLWVRAGGPNQSPVTGLDVDSKGRVYWTAGTKGRSQAAYLLRLNADGSSSEWEYERTRGWCVDLHHSDEQLNDEGQYWWFYKRGWSEGNEGGYFDYDGEGGWAPVKFWLRGIRQGGQVVVLPDGDIVVSGTMQYDFQVKGKQGFPAFDVLLARYRSDGKLLWSTNLYREGDSVHTPDQKAQDLHYDPNTGDLYMVAWQHGSNQYRFKGNLVGDTGNISIFWIGRVDAEKGDLLDGWYFHNIKPGSNGRFQEDGTPTGWPKLSGNYISRVSTDDRGRVYVTGRGAPVTWTCENAHQSWPDEQWSRYGFLYVLTPNLDNILYATIVRGTETDEDGKVVGESLFDGLAVTSEGVYVAGWVDILTLDAPRKSPLTSFFGVDVGDDEAPAWVSGQRGKADAAVLRFSWE